MHSLLFRSPSTPVQGKEYGPYYFINLSALPFPFVRLMHYRIDLNISNLKAPDLLDQSEGFLMVLVNNLVDALHPL